MKLRPQAVDNLIPLSGTQLQSKIKYGMIPSEHLAVCFYIRDLSDTMKNLTEVALH